MLFIFVACLVSLAAEGAQSDKNPGTEAKLHYWVFVCPLFVSYLFSVLLIKDDSVNYMVVDQVAFGVSTVVVATCICVSKGKKNQGTPEAERVVTALGAKFYEAHCIEDLVPGLERGNQSREAGIMLRWICDNYENMKRGAIRVVMFHHSHENSWHQKNFSGQMWKLLGTDEGRKYLFGNDFGDIYPNIGDFHQLEANFTNLTGEMKSPGSSTPYWRAKKERKPDVMYLLKEWTAGTGFEWVNTSINKYRMLRHPLSATFFVSSRLVLQRPLEHYKRLLARLQVMSQKYGDKYMGYMAEFSWRILFHNRTWPEYNVSIPSLLGPPLVLIHNERCCNPPDVLSLCPPPKEKGAK